MRLRGKKGASEALSLIIVAAILLIILAVSLGWIKKPNEWINAATSCTGNGGVCTDQYSGCGEGYRRETFRTCSNNQVCCMPNNIQTGELDRFTGAQRTALANPIFLTIGDNPNPVTEVSLSEGQGVSATIKFNDKLPEKAFGPVLVYMTDANSGGQTYSAAVFHRSEVRCTGKPECSVISGSGQTVSIASSLIQSMDAAFGESNFPRSGSNIKLGLNPQLQNSYEKRNLHIVILDGQKIACSKVHPPSQDQDAWLKCLNSGSEVFDASEYVGTKGLENAKKLLSDSSNWLAGKSYKITVKPVLEISGVSGNWVADDTITVTANKPDYSELSIALVNARELTSLSQIIDECTKPTSDKRTGFKNEIHNIVGTTTDISGIPLNLNIGGFRIPTATLQLKYITNKVLLKIVNNKADVKIDKATMIKNFYEDESTKREDLFIGQNAYVCAKASKVDGTVAHAVSSTPLKVDVLPPATTSEEIRVVYPEITINTPAYQQQYPSMAGRQKFFQQYPRVVIPCQDYGQSGCASYDYYLKTGNFVNVNVQSTNWEDAVTGLALQYGLNALFSYFASIDPEKTICPYLYSNEFRLNRQSSISVKTQGQSIMCIRIKDNVGNARLVWKEIYSPSEMMERVAVEAASEVVSEAITS